MRATDNGLLIAIGAITIAIQVEGEKITAKHLQLIQQYLALAEAQLTTEERPAPDA